MRVAFVNRMLGFTRGGGEIWDLKMADHLRELGVDVTFVTAEPLHGTAPNPVTEFPSVSVPVPHLQERALAAPRGIGGVLSDVDAQVFANRVAARLRSTDGFDLVHVNGLPEFARYLSAFDGPVTIKMNGPPHSLWYDRLNPFRNSYDLLAAFDAIITTGVTTDAVQSNVDHDRHVTINPGVETDQFTPDGDASSRGDAVPEASLLFVGRFVPAKNLPLLIDAVGDLRDRGRNVALTLVGDGPTRERVERRIKDRGVDSVVTLPGYVDNEDLPGYYRAADAFVLSSRTDNCPITVLEAMSCGTPVVAPRVGWIPNLLTHGREGLLYETGDRTQLADALERITTDEEERERMGRAARERAVDEFDWESRARDLRALYRDLLA